MKSWFYQTNRCYGQGDAPNEMGMKARLLAWGLIKEDEVDSLEIWEATPSAKLPSFPRSKEEFNESRSSLGSRCHSCGLYSV